MRKTSPANAMARGSSHTSRFFSRIIDCVVEIFAVSYNNSGNRFDRADFDFPIGERGGESKTSRAGSDDDDCSFFHYCLIITTGRAFPSS